jgi:hypothetical protein
MHYIKYLDMLLCSKHVEVFNVMHVLQNKEIVHQVGK